MGTHSDGTGGGASLKHEPMKFFVLAGKKKHKADSKRGDFKIKVLTCSVLGPVDLW